MRSEPRCSMDEPSSALAVAPDGPEDGETGFDLVVADASWSWTERLFSPMAEQGVRVLRLKACDWRTAWVQRRPWRDWLGPRQRLGPNLWEWTLVLPPGWMKSFPQLGMRPIARAVREWHQSLPDRRPLVMAISYPHYLHLRDQVRPDALIYYNMDDYALYWPSRSETIRRLERRAVGEADLSVFCARIRAEELAQAVPDAQERIIHLPHGAPAGSIAESPRCRPGPPPPDLAALPRPRLGFIGSLGDRIDWPLVEQTARAFPEGSVVLIGREPVASKNRAWYPEYQNAVARPNVHRLGWRSQAEIGRYAAAFDVCLIPYRADHPFNRVACPTKVMDYMATSRPVVSTDLPECRLYAHLFDIADDPAMFIAAIRRVVDRDGDDGRSPERWATARAATWEQTSATLLRHFREQWAGRTRSLKAESLM